jgi:hypothetical protein
MFSDAKFDERRARFDERQALLKPSGKWGPIFRARHLVRAQVIAVLPSVVVGLNERWGYYRNVEFMVRGVWGLVFSSLALFVFVCPLLVMVRLATEFPREKWALWAVPLSIGLTFIEFWALLPAVS